MKKEYLFEIAILFSISIFLMFSSNWIEQNRKTEFTIYSFLFLVLLFAILYFRSRLLKKDIQKTISQFRNLASSVSRNSLILVGSNKRILSKSQNILNEFERAMTALENVKEISEKNSAHAKNTSTVGQDTYQSAKNGQNSIEKVISQVTDLNTDSEKIGQITDLINDIAFKTNLLALNASVEAARVGEHGKGFAIVAGAVKELAEQSAGATSKISSILGSIVEKSNSSKHLVADCGISMNHILSSVTQTAEMSNEIALGTKTESDQINSISASLKEIEIQTKENLGLTDESVEIVDNLSIGATQFEAVIGQLVELAGGPSVESRPIKKALAIAQFLSKQTQKVFESELAKNSFKEKDIFVFSYYEIKNEDIEKLKYLFDISRVPNEGFNPKKYFTNYDRFVDKTLQVIFDKVLLENKEFIFALPVDLNAFGFTHNSKYCKPWRGNYDTDLAENRIKRFFHENMTFLRSARVGLHNFAENLPIMFDSYSELEKLVGAQTLSPKNSNEYLVQSYYRDTGELATNLSVPIYINNRRFGTIVVCWI